MSAYYMAHVQFSVHVHHRHWWSCWRSNSQVEAHLVLPLSAVAKRISTSRNSASCFADSINDTPGIQPGIHVDLRNSNNWASISIVASLVQTQNTKYYWVKLWVGVWLYVVFRESVIHLFMWIHLMNSKRQWLSFQLYRCCFPDWCVAEVCRQLHVVLHVISLMNSKR